MQVPNLWPLVNSDYDRSPRLTAAEQEALNLLLGSRLRRAAAWPNPTHEWKHSLQRLATPLHEALAAVEGTAKTKDIAVTTLLRSCGREQLAFWGWDDVTWRRILGPTQAAFFAIHEKRADGRERQFLMAAAYRLGCWTDVRAVGDFERVALAEKVFGRAVVASTVQVVQEMVTTWGYAASSQRQTGLAATLCETLLLNRSPFLSDLTTERLEEFRREVSDARRSLIFQLARALVGLGLLPKPLPVAGTSETAAVSLAEVDTIDTEWVSWVKRWDETSTVSIATRQHVRLCLLKAGRWLHALHPHITKPQHWERDLCIAYTAAVVRMNVGDYIGPREEQRVIGKRRGQPLSARSKASYLGAMRMFFRDCQEWGWLTPRFDPGRVFATPRSVKALIGPAPRTIAADVWAKLLWAGLHLDAADLPGRNSNFYPVELLRALSVVWLFAGLRSDEIVRLSVGCVRWQSSDVVIPTTGEVLPKEAVCLLDVPVNKTSTSFTKPVDPVVGEAITAWEKLRPHQPPATDRKSAETVQFLFSYRARPVPRQYLNGSLIPILCAKAGVPMRDVRGSITSHRARATIASQLFNAREPMTLFELQAWLGHRSPASTQHYVAITPTKLAKAYADAGYFARNVRAIEVLIDQDSVKTGAAAAGSPWRYYDLGHGLCTYEFFDQCPHRMACARCDFYVPKTSSLSQLIEAKGSLLRLLQQIPLTEDECTAADGDLRAVEQLMSKLATQPTPSGQTPLELHQRDRG